jgi:hypothetical protein
MPYVYIQILIGQKHAYAIRQSQEKIGDPSELLGLARRAARSVPDCGGIWALYMRIVEKATRPTEDMEQFEWEETVEGELLSFLTTFFMLTWPIDIYRRMLQMNLVQKSVDDLVITTLTRASWSRRTCFVEEDGETVIGEFCHYAN